MSKTTIVDSTVYETIVKWSFTMSGHFHATVKNILITLLDLTTPNKPY
jgi:hypothetical protein